MPWTAERSDHAIFTEMWADGTSKHVPAVALTWLRQCRKLRPPLVKTSEQSDNDHWRPTAAVGRSLLGAMGECLPG